MLLGAHVSSTGGIDTAVDRAEALRLQSIQIFAQSTRMWRQTNHTPEAIARFRERRAETGLGAVVIHATYLINLAATDDAVYAKSLKALSSTVGVGTAIGADGVVFHVGSHLGRGLEAAMHQIVPGLQVVLGERDPDGPWLLLENSAGHQGTIGVTIEELALIIDELGRPEQVGICLDTCHLFASGIDITTPGGRRRPARRGRLADRPRPAALPARQRLEDAVRLEPRPARQHRAGRDRQEAVGHARAPEAAGAAGHRRDAGTRQPRAGQGRDGPVRPHPPGGREAMADGDVVEIGAAAPLPVSELDFRFTRSGGPGGQHVNTSSTRAELTFDLAGSPTLTDQERERAMRRLRSRLDSEGRLRVVAQDERSQRRNRSLALRRFAELMQRALAPPPPPRRPTRPSRASATKRIEGKRRAGQNKRLRRPPDSDD